MSAPPPSIADVPMSDDAKLALLRAVAAGHLREEVVALNARLSQFEKLFATNQNVVDFVATALPQAMQQAHMPRTRPHLDAAMGDPWIGAASYAAEHKLEGATQALSPIILPAIGQAVKERLAALSKAMERASPARRVQWKIKSLQTGLPLETVMEQDLDPFRVHSLLAVEMPAGNLLASYRVPEEGDAANSDSKSAEHAEDDAYATAALLTALRSFVRDAGIGAGQGELSSIDVGKRTLHIGQQGSLMVAVEASGSLALDLEPSMHSELFPALRSAKSLDDRRAVLARWRTGATDKTKPKSPSALKLILLICLALLAGLWWAKRAVEQTDIARTLSRLRSAPGVASASYQRVDGGWQLFVAADPLAQVEPIVQDGLIPRQKIGLLVDPVLSLDPTSTARALEQTLPPPVGVRLVVTRTEVRVLGTAAKEYFEALRQHPRVRLSNLTVTGQTSTIAATVTN